MDFHAKRQVWQRMILRILCPIRVITAIHLCRAGEDEKPDLSDVWILNGLVFPEYYVTSRCLTESEKHAA